MVSLGESGDVFGDGVVEGELALFLKEEDGGGGELLGDGADGVAHLGGGGDVRVKVGEAVGVGVDE